MANERKYLVKDAYRTNLDSMITKVWCYIDDIQEGKYQAVKVMGKVMDEDDLYSFIQEMEDLECKAHGRVTGKEYGRIKAISDERNLIRYATCISSGMDEKDAGYAFFD